MESSRSKRATGKRRLHKKSRRRLDAAAIRYIETVIASWPAAPLTWKSVIASIAGRYPLGWTRQALSAHTEIRNVFQERKNQLRKDQVLKNRGKISSDPAVVVLRRQLVNAKSDLQKLQNLVSAYEARFLIMIRNASIRGINQIELEKPLPEIMRSTANRP